jgi:hypothetical protein
MRTHNPHRLFSGFSGRLKSKRSAHVSTNKKAGHFNAWPIFNSQVHASSFFRARGFFNMHQTAFRQFAGMTARSCVFGLLLDKPVVRPEALRIAIAGIHEFDVMADHAHDAETRILRRGHALISGEEFLHLLLFTGLRVQVDGVEFILRQATIRIGLELDGLLRLDHDVLRLHSRSSQTHNGENNGNSHFHIYPPERVGYSG